MNSKMNKITVKFTQQQMELLDRLKQEGKFGEDYPEIVVALFHEYIRQTFGKGGL